MDTLKQYVNQGKVQIARMDSEQKPVQVQFSEFERTVKTQNDMAKVYQSLLDLSREEKYEWANFKRLRGNQFYRQKKYDEAIEVYLKALIGLDFKEGRSNGNKTNSQTEQIKQNQIESLEEQSSIRLQTKFIIKQELMFPILLNMATCFYKKSQYAKALALCDKILIEQGNIVNCELKQANDSPAYKKIHSKLAECLFKKAYILIEIGEFDQAKKIAQKLNNWDGYQKQQFRENGKQISQIIQNKKRKQADVYKKIFRGSQKDSQELKPLISRTNQQIGNPENEQQILYPRQGFCEVIVDWFMNCSKGIIGKRNKNKNS